MALFAGVLFFMNLLGMCIAAWLPDDDGGDFGRVAIALAAGYASVTLAYNIADRNGWL